jgi:predicted O-methyltransferase YrrM
MSEITMTIAQSKAWRPELEGYSDDILPWYDRLARDCSYTARFLELGVARGRSLAFLAQRLRRENKGGVELWGVDEWAPGWVQISRDLFRHTLPEELDMIRFVRASSERAVRLFDDGYFDFVFIDADHSFEAAKDDIRLWLPKVKPGGMICGHDYTSDAPGVVKAVDEARARHEWTDFAVDGTVWSARPQIHDATEAAAWRQWAANNLTRST